MRRNFFLRQLLLGLVLGLGQISFVYGQTSAFTYQGRFTDGGAAANGTYEMQFKLFDGASNQIGSTITNAAISVSDGVFTVPLDYGSAAFSGADRFLEIGVRPAGSGNSFTVLAPRQQLTSAVYAIRAGNAASADTATNTSQLGGVAASQYVQTNDSRLSDSRPPTAGSSAYIQNTTNQQAATNFNISGIGTAGHLSANAVNAVTQFNINGSRVLSAPGDNTFAGIGAGSANLGGARNSYFGTLAGNANTAGSNNSFFGWIAGNQNQGFQNSFFGASAGASNKNANGNSFFGYGAGSLNTSGDSNSFFGANAGLANTSSSNNSFFGKDAGAANADGDGNAFFGSNAGAANKDGKDNAFFGKAAGAANKGGDHNAFFGESAGAANIFGNQNSFFGRAAGESNTNGGFNSFFGYQSGDKNQTGQYNSFFGHDAGYANDGDDNAYFGYGTGAQGTTAAKNAFFGSNAGNENIDGESNSFFGNSSGHTNTSGSNNTIIGASADVDSKNLNFATAIGAGSLVNTSNTIVLGRSNGSDNVRVPGTLTLGLPGVAGNTSMCRNVLNQISFCSSSLRYKTNIQPFIGGLSVLNRLRPITFDWKQGGMHDLGFGAEDIAAVEPLLVTRNEKGEVEGVKYDRITAVLVNAVKEQQQQIRAQEEELRDQQQRFVRQQSQLHRQQSEIEDLKKLLRRQTRRTATRKRGA